MEYSALTNEVLCLDSWIHRTTLGAQMLQSLPQNRHTLATVLNLHPLLLPNLLLSLMTRPANVNDMVEPSNSNNIAANKAREHGGRKGGIPPNANPNLSPAAVKTLISRIPDQKLQSVSAPATFLHRCSIP